MDGDDRELLLEASDALSEIRMRSSIVAVTLVPLIFLGAARFRAAVDIEPPWAYPVNASGFSPEPEWPSNVRLPMPDIVARGRKPEVPGCGSCHLPNGFGRPENASLAGLPTVYIARQMEDFRRGVRKSSEPEKAAPSAMAAIGKAADEAEVRAASEYFASISFKQWTRVIESDTAPKAHSSDSGLVQVDERGIEPIGGRIVEVPADRSRAELREAASGFVAYVPVGSIRRGQALVTTGAGGRTVRCALCHGEDLKGVGPVPALAGRSPSYVVRQLYDMQHGARHGFGADLMKATVARLTKEDVLSIAAYTASRVP